jgi:RNA polymerase sigma-70 factor (ECF subfamily)
MDRLEKDFLAAYDAYADAIYRHCFFRVYSKARAEELMQETFTKTWEYVRDGKQVENLRAFLYRVANNLVIDASRKKREESLDALLEESDAYEPRTDGRITTEQNILLRQVMETIHKLPEGEREILTMRYVDDLDPKDIAEVLGITANNASVRLNRAMQSLKEQFHND